MAVLSWCNRLRIIGLIGERLAGVYRIAFPRSKMDSAGG